MTDGMHAAVSNLQSIYSFNIWEVKADGSIGPWLQVDGKIILQTVINENNLLEEVQLVPGQIMYWGRMVAQAKRIWEITERQYRSWRDAEALALLDPPMHPDGWKKPTEKLVDSKIRGMRGYTAHYQNQERAEEAYNSAVSVLDAFRAKKDIFKTVIIKRNEDGAPMLGV